MDRTAPSDSVAAMAAIGDPVRRRLFRHLLDSAGPVGRDDAARTLDLPRSTAAFHLDRLVAAGLATVEYARLSGRSGPGAGRPAKLYRARSPELLAAVPERRYDLLADLLAAAVASATRSGAPVAAELARVAHARGVELGKHAATLHDALALTGYEPDGDAIGNCPFRLVAGVHTEVVCGANRSLVEGLIEGTGAAAHAVPADPTAGGCCVQVVADR